MSTYPMEEYIQKWDAARAAKDYIECMVISVDAFKKIRSTRNSNDIDAMLRLVQISAKQLCSDNVTESQQNKTACSFCYTDVEKKRVVRGANIVICEDCVELANTLVNNMESRGDAPLNDG